MEEVCRLCLQAQPRDVIPLFSCDIETDDDEDDECRLLRLQIADLCSIVIMQDDNLPKFVCCKCKMKLRDAHEFVRLCKRSNDKLLKQYETNKRYQNQNEEIISSKVEKRKVRERTHNCIDKSLKSAGTSLLACSTISNSSETCDTTLSLDKLNENIETGELLSDKCTESDFSFKIRKVPSRELVILDHSKAPDKKLYLCDVCSNTFVSMSRLRFHLKSHYGPKPHACQYCGKCFAIPSYKKRHERTHIGDKQFVCHVCSTAFASSNGLKYHLRTHTGEANYRCSTCGKSFARRKYLKEHTFTHTGEKPFVCRLCGSAYGNSGSLFVHEKKCKSRLSRDVSGAVAMTMIV